MSTLAHKVQFFSAKCQACGHGFSMPLLSDFSYGEFIFHGERQCVFGFLSAQDEPAWEDIEVRLRRSALLGDRPTRPQIERLHRVIAVAADSIAGQRLVSFPVCPSCGARSVAYGDSDPQGIHEIPQVSFQQYQSLSDSERSRRVEQLWRESKCP
ncbi:MAG: hypothetical protein IPK32_17835 [Verrucomicrobiaceae bacterium]|nr:hypothetical protein [Verrucomicrobiaceae bacterium]